MDTIYRGTPDMGACHLNSFTHGNRSQSGAAASATACLNAKDRHNQRATAISTPPGIARRPPYFTLGRFCIRVARDFPQLWKNTIGWKSAMFWSALLAFRFCLYASSSTPWIYGPGSPKIPDPSPEESILRIRNPSVEQLVGWGLFDAHADARGRLVSKEPADLPLPSN
jgi:hypothetical protein